jgi:hypothetical protein
MSRRPTVRADLAEAVDRLDELLRRDFGQVGFEYHIVALGRTLAAANTERCAHRPNHRILPKCREAIGLRRQ